MVQCPDPPQFGRQRVQVLPDGDAVVHATVEIIKARKGEDAVAFLLRLARKCGVKPTDKVEITYRDGMPQFAQVEWSKTER